MAGTDQPSRAAWTRYVRAQDFVWLLLFAALAVFGPEHTDTAMFLLSCLAVFQVAMFPM